VNSIRSLTVNSADANRSLAGEDDALVRAWLHSSTKRRSNAAQKRAERGLRAVLSRPAIMGRASGVCVWSQPLITTSRHNATQRIAEWSSELAVDQLTDLEQTWSRGERGGCALGSGRRQR
jgi:hypothetical protein